MQGNISNVPQAFADALARADNANKSQHFFFANGQSVGSFGQLQDGDGKFKANFDVNYTAISDEYPSSVPVSVVAQDGDTLRTLAARVFGDQNLWYVLAEENGLTDPDAVIGEGTVIQVPNEVLSVSNASGSFKPFNIADAIGDTQPTQPAPPRPKKKGCGVLGQILMVAVAIVVSVYTAGLATSVIAPTATAAAGSGAAALGSAALSGSLIGASAGAGIAAAAIGGAVGAAASQGLAIAMGMQDSFDWKGVALGAIGAGVTSGIGAAGAAFEAGRTGALASMGRGLNSIGTMGQAAVRSALTQGIAVATGLQSSFSWRDVAISAVAAPIADQAGQLATSIPIVGGFAGRFASGVAGSYVRRAFGGRVETATILADAFGNALGNSLVNKMQPNSEAREQQELQQRESFLAAYNANHPDIVDTVFPVDQFIFDVPSSESDAAASATGSVFENSDGIEEMIVEGRWNDQDSRNARHLGTPIYLGGAGMKDDYGDEIAQRALTMTDMGFDPLRQANDLAIVNELFTPWGQFRTTMVGSYNFGEKLGGGLRSIDNLFRDGVDAAVAEQEETRAAAGIQLDSAFARAIAPQIERMDPSARLALEVVGDAAFFVPMAAEFRGMTSEISAFNRPLLEFSPSSSGPRQFANQVGAVGDLSSLTATKLRNTPGVATASGELTPASGNWLDPNVPTPIPGQIAESLVGREFATFAKLREAIWRAIAADPELSKVFSAANRGNIEAGNAPFVPPRFATSRSDAGERFNLHHVEYVENGGPVYDLSNLQIVSPKVHAEIHH